MTTSLAQETIKYGVYIRPENHCRVINNLSQEERLLVPGLEYNLPWQKDEITIIVESPNLTGETKQYQMPRAYRLEMLNWLKVAESAFRFWDNEIDNAWNNL